MPDVSPAATLAAKVESWSGRLFAVVDGAKYRNVRKILTDAGLIGICLFPDLPSQPAAAPYLVPIDKSGLARLTKIPAIEGACVLWEGHVDELTIFRHLRTINQARIPRQRSEATPGQTAMETVLFRHWDPSVLELLLPLLTLPQLSKLFGPLTRLTLFSTTDGGALTFSGSPHWPAPDNDPLELSASQLADLTQALKLQSHRTIVRYLRDTTQSQTSLMTDDDLLRFVGMADCEASKWGIRTEAGLGRFAWLLLATGGRLTEVPEVRAFLGSGEARADERMRQLMRAMAVQLEFGVRPV